MYAVVVNEGPVMADDNAVYFTHDMPTFEAVEVPCEGKQPSRVVFLCFTPSNGGHRGKQLRVPFTRVVSISDDV
jgi:hypothetical protein